MHETGLVRTPHCPCPAPGVVVGSTEPDLLPPTPMPDPAPQDELVAGNYMKPPPDAALAEKTAARANKAAARAAKGAAKRGQGGGGGKGGPGAAAAAAAAVGGGEGGSAGARRYTSPGGFTVLVGRNNKQNDVLSTKVRVRGVVVLFCCNACLYGMEPSPEALPLVPCLYALWKTVTLHIPVFQVAADDDTDCTCATCPFTRIPSRQIP